MLSNVFCDVLETFLKRKFVSWVSVSSMLHFKFHCNRSTGSGEEDFWMVFTKYERGGHLDHVTLIPRADFRFKWNLTVISPVVTEEMMFKYVDGRTTDGQTDGRRMFCY